MDDREVALAFAPILVFCARRPNLLALRPAITFQPPLLLRAIGLLVVVDIERPSRVLVPKTWGLSRKAVEKVRREQKMQHPSSLLVRVRLTQILFYCMLKVPHALCASFSSVK